MGASPRLQALRRWASDLRPRPAIFAAAGVALGTGLVAWAQMDFGQRHFTQQDLRLLLVGVGCAVGAALAAGYRPLVPADGEGTRANSLPRIRWRSWRAVALPLALVLTVLAFWLNDKNLFNGKGVACWIAAIILFLAVWWERSSSPSERPEPPAEPPSRLDRWLPIGWPIALALLVAGLAIFFRFYHLNTLPDESGGIEADIGDNVRDIVNGRFMIYMWRKIGEGGLLYPAAGVVKLFGVVLDYNLLKVTTASAGVLAVGATYFMLKELFSDRFVALVGALFMAVGHWPVAITRLSLMMAAAPLGSAVTLLFLVRGLKYNRRNDFLLCGFTAGLGLYFYQGLRALPVLIAACLTLKFLVAIFSRRLKDALALAVNTVLLGVMFLIVFAPMARTWHDYPSYYMEAVRGRSMGTDAMGDFNILGRLATNFKSGFFMFNWSGDWVSVHNIVASPALDNTMAAFLLVGAALGIAAWLRYRRGLFPYAAVAFTVLLLPSILVLAFPGENPNFARTSGAAPLTYGFVALPVCVGLSCLQRAFPRRVGLVVASLILAGLMAGLTTVNFRWYFEDYDDSYHSVTFDTSDVAATIKETRERDSSITDVYLVGYPGWIDWRGLHLILAQPEWFHGDYPIKAESVPVPTPGRLLFVLYPYDQESRQRLERLFPGAEVSWREGQKGAKDAYLLFLTPVLQ